MALEKLSGLPHVIFIHDCVHNEKVACFEKAKNAAKKLFSQQKRTVKISPRFLILHSTPSGEDKFARFLLWIEILFLMAKLKLLSEMIEIQIDL